MYRMFATIALLTMAQAAPNPHLPGPTYDTAAPTLPKNLKHAVLILSKTNGWRHIEHIPHSNMVLADIAANLGHASYTTENAAIFNDEQLRHFSVIILNSASGDFLTEAQRSAFARFVARGVDERFDAIVCNPPFHALGRGDRPDIGRAFIAAAAAALKPGGRLWLVANRHLPYEHALGEGFAQVRTLAQNGGFKIVEATKAAR